MTSRTSYGLRACYNQNSGMRRRRDLVSKQLKARAPHYSRYVQTRASLRWPSSAARGFSRRAPEFAVCRGNRRNLLAAEKKRELPVFPTFISNSRFFWHFYHFIKQNLVVVSYGSVLYPLRQDRSLDPPTGHSYEDWR